MQQRRWIFILLVSLVVVTILSLFVHIFAGGAVTQRDGAGKSPLLHIFAGGAVSGAGKSPLLHIFAGGAVSGAGKSPLLQENFDSQTEIQLVISRYNEDLDWIRTEPFNKYKNIIYNKSDNSDFYTSDNTEKTIQVENVGRCDHTYLYHIINNYDNLSNITVFVPGSLNIDYKNKKTKRLINEIESREKNVFLGKKFEDIKHIFYNFQLDEWKSSDENNSKLNPEKDLELASVRPFGKWYDTKFKDRKVDYVSFGGIFSVNKNEILQHPKSYYEDLIKELENSSNPEVGHYFERSWNAVFHPMTETDFVEGLQNLHKFAGGAVSGAGKSPLLHKI